MINLYLNYKTKNLDSVPPSLNDIKKSKKILFSIFTRYGDTIIDLMIIKEFIELYPKKYYLILCPRQMQPYVEEFLPGLEFIAFNKRNFFEITKVVKFIQRKKFDIGFNPWSNGLDSSFYISFCDKFLFYKDFDKPNNINHYEVVRKYLKLFEKKWEIKKLKLKDNYQKILICPQSTDSRRNLSIQQLDILVVDFQRMYNQPEIVIASSDKSDFRKGCSSFEFKKSSKSSQEFIELVKKNTLIVCADSGPLHIALALQKDLIALMRVTVPEIVINTGSCLRVDGF